MRDEDIIDKVFFFSFSHVILSLLIKKERDRVFGNDNWRRRSKDGFDRSGSNCVMADAKACEGCPSIFGLANFYCQLIQDFSKIAVPLHNLTCKETVWRWGGSQQKVFDELKRRFVEGPILVAADYMLPLWGGQLAYLPTPPFPGILAEHILCQYP